MKLSWLSTSEAHKHTSMYMIWQYESMHKVIERERVNGSNANNKICFEVRAPSSTSPPSPRRISNPLTCPHRTPTQGTSTENLGQLQPVVHNSSLNPIQPLTRGNTNTTSHKRGRPLANKTNHLTLEGFQHKTPPLTRGS